MSDNMRIWERVEKTDPSMTKEVNKGSYSLTAINATYQIQKATEVFGPIGEGWGYMKSTMVTDPALLVFEVQLWHRDESGDQSHPIVQFGSCNWWIKPRNGEPYLDQDAPKKALTDGVTKCLSLLGFNADVHMGKFDDNKYVAEMREEFGAPQPPKRDLPPDRVRRDTETRAPMRSSLAKESADAIRSKAAPLPGDPEWFDENAPFKKFGSPPWREMSEGGIDGDHYSYMKWAVSEDGFLTPSRGKAHGRALVCMQIIEQRHEDRQVAIAKREEEALDEPDWTDRGPQAGEEPPF